MIPVMLKSASNPPPELRGRRFWKRRDDDQEQPRGSALILVVVALVAAFLLGLAFIPNEIESSVQAAVEKALQRSGLAALDVSTDGQDVRISGTVSSGNLTAEIAKLHAIVRGATCDTRLLGEVVCPAKVYVSVEEKKPSRELVNKPSSRGAPAVPAKSDGKIAKPISESNWQSSPIFHNFIISKDEDLLTIEGDMPDRRVRDLMLRQGTRTGAGVIDEMAVTERPASDYFAWAVERAWSIVPYLDNGRISWLDGKFSVSGKITSDQADAVEAAYQSEFFAEQLAGLSLNVEPVYNDVLTCNQAFAAILEHSSIEFRPQSAELLVTSEPLLDRLAVLAEQCTLPFIVENHTAGDGDAEQNLKLSQARAESVVDALVARGIDSVRLTARGFGGAVPKDNNNTPQARMQNRRTVIVARQ